MARKSNALTAREVTAIKVPGRYADGAGLYLQVSPKVKSDSVTKSWLFRFTFNGKPKQMGLGSLNTVSLAEARGIALECRKLVQAGIDPITKRQAARAAEKTAALLPETFKDFAEEYIRLNGDGWKNDKHRAQWGNTLSQYVYPVFGGLHVNDVTKAHVLQVLEPIWTEKTETARRIRGRIETVLDMSIAADVRTGDNPARLSVLKFLLPNQAKARKVKHHPALPYAEVGAFVRKLRQRNELSAKVLEFLILTAGRTGEVIEAKWAEIDRDNALWIVPDERMKAGREHRVPLTHAALTIIDAMPVIDGNPYLFPGHRKQRPLSNMAMLQLMRRMGFGEYTAHGFRSTFRQWAAEQSLFPREVAEAALAHGNPDKVEAAYQRGDFFEKRRKLMEAWSAYCGTVPKSGGNVAPICKRAG